MQANNDRFYGNEARNGRLVTQGRDCGRDSGLHRGKRVEQRGFCGVIDAEVERLMVRRHFGKARNYRTARVSFSGFLASVLGVDDIGVERIDAPLIASDDEAVAYRQYRSALSLHNKRLKAVSAMLGGGVHLSSYVARHTWASLAQECSLPMHIISTTMGHTSERTTRIYLGTLDDSLIDRACRKVWKKLKIPTST